MKATERIIQLAKNSYMTAITLISRQASKKPSTREIAYLLSFPENDTGLIQALAEAFSQKRIAIYYTVNCLKEAIAYQQQGFTIYPLKTTALFFTKVVPKLARAQLILCDNYFAFLGSLAHQAEIIQLWHANGATKRFGWEDQKTLNRTKADQQRFQAVYNQFDQFLVGSDLMGQVFVNSYRVSTSKLLPIGVPRTDYYFNEGQKKAALAKFQRAFPEAVGKRVIVYAPTYRDQEFSLTDWQQVRQQLEQESIIICRFHPHMKVAVSNELSADPAILMELRGLSLAELLFSVDCLISDYSSVPFEYALARPTGQLLLFFPDLANYQKNVGLQSNFNTWAQGMYTESLAELINQIDGGASINLEKVNGCWNEYNDGNATARLLDYLTEKLKEED